MKLAFPLLFLSLAQVQGQLTAYNLSALVQVSGNPSPGFEVSCPEVNHYCGLAGSWQTIIKGSPDNIDRDEEQRFADFGYPWTFRWLTANAGNVGANVCNSPDPNDCQLICDTACTCEQGSSPSGNFVSDGPCDVLEEFPNDNFYSTDEMTTYLSNVDGDLPYMETTCSKSDLFADCQRVTADGYGTFGNTATISSATDNIYRYSDCNDGNCLAACHPSCTCADEASPDDPGVACTTTVVTMAPSPTSAPTAAPSVTPSPGSSSLARGGSSLMLAATVSLSLFAAGF